MSQPGKQNKKLGALLVVISVACWGLFPVASKGILDTVDAYTLNFYRFVAATLILSIYLFKKNQTVILVKLSFKHYGLIVSAVLGLLLNHVMFMDALNYVPASASQVILQVGPISLLLVSVIVFGEDFSPGQWFGTALFVFGLGLFFNQRLIEIFAFASEYSFGIIYMAVASLIWIFYGLAQKLLIGAVSPIVILLCCYFLGTLMLLPVSEVGIIMQLNQIQLCLLVVCTSTSLAAYICFGESLVHWEASKSSALLAFIPIATLSYEYLFSFILPGYITAETLNWGSIAGLVLVVAGCLLVTYKKTRSD